jgi:hypothetical protein
VSTYSIGWQKTAHTHTYTHTHTHIVPGTPSSAVIIKRPTNCHKTQILNKKKAKKKEHKKKLIFSKKGRNNYVL